MWPHEYFNRPNVIYHDEMQALFDLESIRVKLLKEKEDWEKTKADMKRNTNTRK